MFLRRITQTQLEFILLEHVRWLADRSHGKRASLIDTDLTGLDFSHADLRMAVLSGSNFECANMAMANLTGAITDDIVLNGTNFDGAVGYDFFD